MKNRLFAIFILFIGLSIPTFAQDTELVRVSYANPKEYTVADITVSGVKYLDKETIISLSGLKKGDKISIPGDELTTALKKLWKQKLVGDIQIYITKVVGDDIYLNLFLTERPRLSRFFIEGVSKGQIKDLKEQFGFITGQKVSDALIKNTTNKVYKFYGEKGYYGTKVKVTQHQDTSLNNHIILRYRIDKGNKVKIQTINFSGNEQVTSKTLKN